MAVISSPIEALFAKTRIFAGESRPNGGGRVRLEHLVNNVQLRR